MFLLINIFLFLLSICVLVFSETIFQIANFHFYIYLCLIIIDLFKTRSISLYQVWILAFIYIILSELLMFDGFTSNIDLEAAFFLISTNNILLIGYLSSSSNIKVVNILSIRTESISKNKWANKYKKFRKKSLLGIIPILLLLTTYIVYFLPQAIYSFFTGRNVSIGVEDTSISIGILLSSVGLVLPAVISYYVKFVLNKSAVLSLILAFPIFLILFFNGTRFPLLFSLSGYLTSIGFLKLYHVKLKQLVNVLLVVLLLTYSTSIMNLFRVGGFSEDVLNRNFDESYSEFPISKKIASKMSAEGIFDMTKLNIEYFRNHPHTYGISSGFILYFWIPRALWPEKPTMLGHWLIRKYRTGFGVGHSSSFGFAGELFADFGYLSLFLVFILGVFLKKLEIFRYRVLEGSFSFKMVIASMLMPFVFFFVRSPVTSTITFIGIYIICVFFKLFVQIKPHVSTKN